jgi:hypothetical protein
METDDFLSTETIPIYQPKKKSNIIKKLFQKDKEEECDLIGSDNEIPLPTTVET